MGKKSPKPPPAPDYAAAAQAQGQANLDAARLTARISNPNVSTPYGGQRVTFGKSVFDEAAYNKAMEDYNRQLQEYTAEQTQGLMPMDRDSTMYGYGPYSDQITLSGGRARPVAPTREQFTTTTDRDTPFIEQYLSPEQQKILEAEQRVSLGLSGLGETALGVAQRRLGSEFAPNLRDLQTELSGYGQVQGAPDLLGMGRAAADVQAGGLPTLDIGQFGTARGGVRPQRISYGPREGQYGYAQGGVGVPQLQAFRPEGLPELQGIDASQLPGLRGETPTFSVRGDVTPLMQQTALPLGGVERVQYAPDLGMFGLARSEVPTEQLQRGIDTSQLAAMPVQAGTTGQQAILSRVAPELQRRRAALETQLANQGIPRGSEAYNEAITEQQQQENDAIQQAALQGLQLDMAARAQGFGEAQAAAQFANQAALGQFGMGTTAADVYNRALQQNVGTALSQQQAQNVAQQQDFAQRVAAGEFGNAAQQALFGAGMQQAQFANQAAGQNFQQQLAAQEFANQARAQGFSEQQVQAALSGQQRGQLFGEQQVIQQGYNQAALQQQQAALANQQAYNQAVQQNLQAGLSVQQAQNAASEQLFGQQLASQQLRNAAVAQNQAAALDAYRALLAGQAQGFGQQMDVQAARNAALAQNQAIAAQQQQLANAAQLQQFNQALQGAQFGNTALQQSLQQQLALRNQPLNEIAALMSGVQVNMPQFQGYQGANVAAAPIFAGTQAAGDFAQRNYANQVGIYNAKMGLLGDIAGTAAKFAPSDRRLKSNIERIGTHPLGIGIYEYDIFGERQRGVMADEVETVLPEAVAIHPSGYKMVNYGML